MHFTSSLICWYDQYKRKLPWRDTSDPYRIWVSEVILQQTRVDQGLSYYHRFLDKFPDIRSLAESAPDEVMKVWQGLGYYSRARHMHEAARDIYNNHSSRFPSSYKELIKLKGIGDYSASAIASIAFDESSPVIDGNVLRVISRYFGISEPVNSVKVKKQVKEILNGLIDQKQPGTFNQAMMELGALVCLPNRPNCGDCPLNPGCFALRNKLAGSLPVVEKSKPKKVHYFNYMVFIGEDEEGPVTWLHKRILPGIWRNLYDFPLIETPEELPEEMLLSHPAFIEMTHGTFKASTPLHVERARHILSHKELQVKFFIFLFSYFNFRPSTLNPEGYLKVKLNDVHNYPVPRLIENFLKKVDFDRVYF
jgi:A/G-specific adenine glycosylase